MKIKTHFDGEEGFKEPTSSACVFSVKREMTLLVTILVGIRLRV